VQGLKPCVPEKEGGINPINPRGGLGCSLCLRTKIEHISLNFRPFEAAFSGIDRDLCPSGDVAFYIFYFMDLRRHTFLEKCGNINLQNKIYKKCQFL